MYLIDFFSDAMDMLSGCSWANASGLAPSSCASHLMPRQPARVEVTLLEPSEYVDVLEDSGLTSHFEIFLEHGTGKRWVQCDRCGLFISMTSGGNPILFTKHRDSDECKEV